MSDRLKVLFVCSTFGHQARGVSIEVLGIPDEYVFMDPELVDEIRAQVGRVLPETLMSE